MNGKIDEKEIREALESIREIKGTLKTNVQFLRPFLYDRRLFLLCLYSAVATLVFTCCFYFAQRVWGGFFAFPLFVRIGFIASAGIILILAAAYKWKTFFLVIKKDHGSISFDKLFSGKEWGELVFDNFVMFFFCFVMSILLSFKTGNYMLLLAFFYLFVAFEYFYYAALFFLGSYRISGIFAGILAVLIIILSETVDPVLLAGGSLTLLFLSFMLGLRGVGKQS